MPVSIQLVHGSIISMPVSEESPTFRVATAMQREFAIAAIWQSAPGIGRPMRLPHRRAPEPLSKKSIRFAKPIRIIRSSRTFRITQAR